MGGLPLLRQGEHLSPTWQAYVPTGFRNLSLLIAKRLRYPLHHRGRPSSKLNTCKLSSHYEIHDKNRGGINDNSQSMF